MSRHRVWIQDSRGVHTPSHPLGTRRAAEVFAANRSRFRRDCFVIVMRDGADGALVVYRNGQLRAAHVTSPFDPEPVVAYVNDGAVYALVQKGSS